MSARSVLKEARGFTLVELLIVVAVIAVLASIGVTQLLRARASANEAATIASLRAIASAQLSYSSGCGRGGFATDLRTLGIPPLPFLSPDLTFAATIQKSGYQLTMGAGAGAVAGLADCNGTATMDRYYASGWPLMYQRTGFRSFAVAGSGVIWQESAAVPPTEPFGVPATPLN